MVKNIKKEVIMKKTEEFNLISFESTHMAIKSEKLLKEESLDIRIIPVPKRNS